MKRKTIFILIFIFIFFISLINPINTVYSYEIDEMEEELKEFKIQDFVNSSKEYSGEFFEDIDINKLLNNAIEGEVDNSTIFKRIINLLGGEVLTNIKAIVSILVIILIHSILKSISESLENDNISKLIYYVQYILIVTVIMTNFSDIVKLVQDTASNLMGFMNILVPLLTTLMLYTGNITTSGIIEPIILFMVNFVGNIIQNIIIPFVLILTSLVVISKISDKVQINKLSKFLKSRHSLVFRNYSYYICWNCISRRNII